MSNQKPHVCTFYKARDGWRWRIRSGNGRIVANGGEAFASPAHARRSLFLRALLYCVPLERTKTRERWIVAV